jgi:NAD dependent epimerase/dehydratase
VTPAAVNWKKRVFVTGAGGFIGSHLVEELIRRGATVRAFVRYNSRGEWGLLDKLAPEVRRDIEVIAGDLRDPDAVRRALSTSEIVFHLAALVGIPYSFVHPREVVETNVLGTMNVMTAALESGVERVVHTSTSEVYGTAQAVPMTEEHPIRPQSPYAASKVGADLLAASFRRSFDLPLVTARPFNAYGPRQSARAVIPTIIVQALTGDRVELGAVTPTRDFTYVEDTVDGFLRLAGAQPNDEVIHLGSGFEISIGDLAAKVVEVIGKPVELVSVEERKRPGSSEVERLFCDASKARSLLGWAPRVPLEKGLARTISWVEGHLGDYKAELYAV